jgi:hypothetical protein
VLQICCSPIHRHVVVIAAGYLLAPRVTDLICNARLRWGSVERVGQRMARIEKISRMYNPPLAVWKARFFSHIASL